MKSKIKIVEKSDTNTFRDMPLCYRISLKPQYGDEFVLVITREYFRVGFRDGESFDDFFWDMGLWSSKLGIEYASFITKNTDDKEYHLKMEQKMIREFLIKCEESIKIVENEKRQQIKKLNRKRQSYIDMIQNLDETFRSEKIKKIVGNIDVEQD